MSFDDLLALLGAACVLAGVYLWFGLPPALILLGVFLMYTGWRMEPGRTVTDEPD